jgi:hypothetical protein
MADAQTWVFHPKTIMHFPPVTKQERPECIPLSAAQTGWVHIDKVPLQEQWLPILWRLEGQLHLPAFVQAYKHLIARYEILRTRYLPYGDGFRQEVMPEDEIRLEAFDVTDAPEHLRELEIWKRLKPVCLERTPLDQGSVKLELFKIAEDNFILGGFIHHIAIDGAVFPQFLGDLMGGYYRQILGHPMPARPQLQYADYALWEKRWLTDQRKADAQAFWEHALARARPLILPGGRAQGEPPSPRNVHRFAIPASLTQAARVFASKQGVTLHILFMCVLSILISRWSGQAGVLLGVFSRCRPTGFDNVMGCFTQLRPFFLNTEGDPKVADLLLRARQAAAASADVRKPVPLSLISRLNIGNVLVNYTVKAAPDLRKRGDSRRQAPSKCASITAPDQDLPPPDPAAGKGLPSLQGEVWHNSIEEAPPAGGPPSAGAGDKYARPGSGEGFRWRAAPIPPRADAEGSLRVLGVTAGSTRLPNQLQTEFHHDLHVAVIQTAEALHCGITYASDRFGAARIRKLAAELIELTEVMIQAPECGVSDLAPQIGR